MKYPFIIAFVFSSTTLLGQSPGDSQRNSLSFEFGKTGFIYNLSFDHRFPDKNWGVRVNIGSNFGKYLSAFTTGLGSYYLLGKKSSHLELGVDLNYLAVEEVSDDQKGFVLLYPDYSIKTFYASMNVGYRYYGHRSLFRIGLSPGFIRNGFVPGGYISLGLTFK